MDNERRIIVRNSNKFLKQKICYAIGYPIREKSFAGKLKIVNGFGLVRMGLKIKHKIETIQRKSVYKLKLIFLNL